jgi:hypothetical protein
MKLLNSHYHETFYHLRTWFFWVTRLRSCSASTTLDD